MGSCLAVELLLHEGVLARRPDVCPVRHSCHSPLACQSVKNNIPSLNQHFLKFIFFNANSPLTMGTVAVRSQSPVVLTPPHFPWDSEPSPITVQGCRGETSSPPSARRQWTLSAGLGQFCVLPEGRRNLPDTKPSPSSRMSSFDSQTRAPVGLRA